MKRTVGIVICSAILLAFIPNASATWSIVGVDPETGQVGAAVASCVPLEVLDTSDGFDLIALVAGTGAGISQATYNPAARDEIERLLGAGEDAETIIAAVSAPNFDPRSGARQHGVVVLGDSAVGYTGAENFSVALDRQAPNVSVQGNILVGDDVVGDALAAFVSDPDRTLGDRLVAALEAGSLAGGDSRCGEQTALFAHVSVIDRDGDQAAPNIVDLTTSVERGDGRNPVTELVELYRSSSGTEGSESTNDGRRRLAIGLAAGLVVAAGAVESVRRLRQRVG